ncbi:hypothetical protein BDM02DRAFT_3258206 [Thelephora ganbajun]|uniref:Uncharacterized protein n=1 Tax=Thelephora ganbajun TaxID=370292 RepID=A0ACB6ZTN5_THEGA|nr:hypothetical protein BDM02DRAFT_3258206 [Thelephora ganbajun]
MPFNDLLRQRVQPLANVVTAQRFTLYALASTIAVVAVIANACRNYSNFYSIAVYLGRSGRSVLFLANFCVVLALVSGKVLQKIFFGQLQPREVERLYDQTWMFVTESLLAFTIFRDEFDIPFAIMFGFLLFVKCFHWLMSDRMESASGSRMDQVPYPGPSVLFHVRMVVLFIILATVDVVALGAAMNTIFTEGVGGTVLFANEYAILLASALNSIAKYCINIIEFRHARANGGETAPPWENKSMYLFYIELCTDFMKLTTYLLFFSLIIMKHGLPLNMIRDVYITARSFVTRFRALTRYLSATRDMDRRYPNATEVELSDMSDRTCIICRDELALPDPRVQGQAGPNTTPKKLPCGHIFHFNCLRSWLERQQSCPTCRRTVLESTPQRRAGQQAQRNPPPQPQPAARPAPLFGGQDNRRQQPPNWLNRFLNAAAQPPLVPGQFGNAGNGANGMQNDAFGFAWGQQPAGNQQQVPATPLPWGYPPPAQLQPLPQFPGFYGPDGLWYPWGMQLPLQQPLAQPTPQPVERDTTAPVPQQPATTSASGSTSLTSGMSSNSLTESESTDSTMSDPPRESTRTREATLNAALRRLGLQPASNLRDAVAPVLNGTASTPSPSPLTTSSTSAQTYSSTQPTTSLTHSSTSTQPHLPISASADPNPSTGVPRLLPLTDFSPTPTTFPSTPSFVFSSPTPTTQFARYPPSPRHPGPLSPYYHHSAQGYPTPPTFPSRLSVETTSRRNTLDELLEQLPSTLNEEEIRNWDQVTREAIDERLRVLSRVDEIVNRLVDELTKLRSTIPNSDSIVSDVRSAVDSVGEGSSRKQGRDTGKQREVVPEGGL